MSEGRGGFLVVLHVASSASMGPTSVDVGGRVAWDEPCTDCLGSGFNGADISRCRRGARSDLARYWIGTVCFNGADISRCRREQERPGERQDHHGASMGPTSVDVGGTRSGVEGVRIEAKLQWGRHQSMSEGEQTVSAPLVEVAGFNGADISRCRRVTRCFSPRAWRGLQWGRHQSMSEGPRPTLKRPKSTPGLQWGRHQSMSEGRPLHDGRRLRRPASMGPTSVDVGGLSTAARGTSARRSASMGPTSVDVGGPTRKLRNI